MKACAVFACGLVVLLTARANSQTQARDVSPASRISNRSDLSPYDIKRLIDEDADFSLQDYWRRLKIEPSFFDKCAEMEDAELIAERLDDDRDKELLLRLQKSWTTRYVLYKQRHNKEGRVDWSYVAYLDLENQKYAPPQHRIEYERNSGKERWFVVRARTTWGTGVSGHADQWYKITDKGFTLELTYPAEGYESQEWNGVCSRNISFEDSRLQNITSGTMVMVVFKVEFDCYEPDVGGAKFNKKQTIFFLRPNDSTKFTLDEPSSQITGEVFDAVFNTGAEMLNHETFLQYNFAELAIIADQGSSENRQWLRSFLDKCPDVHKKRELLQFLSAQTPPKEKQ